MDPFEFILETRWEHLPDEVRRQARRYLLDTLGAAIGARQTELSRIIHNFAASNYGGQGAYLWQDGREVSPPGAALANGMTIDSLDIHDGYAPVKGHAGVAIVPTVFATLSQQEDVSGQALLTSMVVGYEIALRAGVSLHATVCDYHTSGAWNALGCAAITARHLGLDAAQTRHALGIAEYHGPRSQMMRCIDHPTMLKDGSGWGAMAGVSAGFLARDGFTGAPALTLEAPDIADTWTDLGQKWLTPDQYIKPYAVCHWAQQAIAGVLIVQRAYNPPLESIRRIRVRTFHEATRLACRHPQSTEEAQYSLPFPVAAALVHGQLGPAQLSGAALKDPLVLNLADKVELVEDDSCNAYFPLQRFARVQIETTAGEVFDSGPTQARWATTPATDAEIREKFRWIASSTLSEARVAEIEEAAWQCADLPNATSLIDLLAAP